MSAQVYNALADARLAMEILSDFTGHTAAERAEHAMEHIEYCRRQVWIAENNEKAAFACLEQDRKELFELRRIMRSRFSNQGGGHEQVARQTSRASSP
jgi:hypothetical protein